VNNYLERMWPNLRSNLGICMERLRKTTKTLSQDRWFAGRELNPRSPEYEAIVLITRLERSVLCQESKPGRTAQLPSHCTDSYPGPSACAMIFKLNYRLNM
jgi:hypothetical protein